MTDRKKQPLTAISKIPKITKEKQLQTRNGIPVWCINAGDQNIIKIDFIFKAGKIYNKNPLIPELANILSSKGTKDLSAEQISEYFDFYGAYFETDIGKHEAVITLFTLTKYFKETFDLFKKIIFNAVFPQNEIDIFLKNRYQTYLINRKKTDIISSELFIRNLFHKKIYGRIIEKSDFKSVNREKTLEFYKMFYSPENMYVIISGKTDDLMTKNILAYINSLKTENIENKPKLDFSFFSTKPVRIRKKTDFSVQSSVRIGKLTINKLHKDYFDLNFAVIVLGGYFGSRLMQNIREEKGYTYGIYAYNMSYLNAGYFLISAESSKEHYENALKEIYKEINILRNVPVSENELNRVKNWLLGNILKYLDGPLSLSEAYRSVLSYNLNSDYFYKYINAVQNMTSEKILIAAQKYLDENEMTEIVVGI